jgi:uncharacterized protein (DUF433 family)
MPVVSEQFLQQVEQFADAVRREAASRGGPPSVQRTPGVCGGEARVRDTRITVGTLIALQRQGASEAELIENFPSLTPSDLDAVWAYYRTHAAEVEVAIAAAAAADVAHVGGAR